MGEVSPQVEMDADASAHSDSIVQEGGEEKDEPEKEGADDVVVVSGIPSVRDCLVDLWPFARPKAFLNGESPCPVHGFSVLVSLNF